MRHIKKFESSWQEIEKEEEEIKKDQIELAGELLSENPMSKDNDLYMFVGRDDFKEIDDGKYTKTLEIENMVKIEPNETIFSISHGLDMRARFQGGKVYHIWLPKEFEDEVSGKGSDSIDPLIVDLINKYKQTSGKKVDNLDQRLKDIRQRRNDINKYNL